MTTPIDCPSCYARLRLPEEHLGKRVRCPRCRDEFVAELPDKQEDDFEVVEDTDASAAPDEDGRPERPASAAQALARKKKKKKKQQDQVRLKWLIGGTVAGGLLVIGLFIWLLIWATAPTPAGPVPDDWKVFEVADRVRVKMPGVPTRTVQSAPGGIQLVMHKFDPDESMAYAVAWSEGPLPPDRRPLPAETLLNDSCNGALANSQGASEESRTSITLGGHPGKKLVMWVPKARGRAVMCMYFNERTGRLYMAMIAGRRLREDAKQVHWFLESLEILEADPAPKEPAPKTPAPKKPVPKAPVPKQPAPKAEPPPDEERPEM